MMYCLVLLKVTWAKRMASPLFAKFGRIFVPAGHIVVTPFVIVAFPVFCKYAITPSFNDFRNRFSLKSYKTMLIQRSFRPWKVFASRIF